MKERLHWLLLFWVLVVFHSLAAVSQAQTQESNNPTSSDDVSHGQAISAQPSSTPSVLHSESPGYSTSEGADLVGKALSILRQLDRSNVHRSSRKSFGLFMTAIHYAKELIPRLHISGPAEGSAESKTQQQKLKGPLSEGISLLKDAAIRNNSDAIYLLAQINFFGNFSYAKNYTQAFERYLELASLDGNSSAQHMVGFLYATGIGDAVERDQSKALLYHTFAAQAGHSRSEMTVAFRHHSGIGTARNCDEAVSYYKKVADKAISWVRSGPPGGRAWVPDLYRLADDDGGAYGEGASVSSAGLNARRGGPNSDANAALDDVLEYLDLMSGKGDFKATFNLGQIYYDGQKGLSRDFNLARRYFQNVASQYWRRDGSTVDITDRPSLEKIASKAAGYLGRMFLRGEGVEQSYKKAFKWFERGIKSGDAGSQNGLGLMYLNGLGVAQNAAKAGQYFRAAADQDFPSAQVNLGALYLDQGDPDDILIASRYFEFAARWSHIEAFYYLAELSNQGIGRDRSCALATAHYKIVAEKAEPLISSFAEANRAYEDGDYELALVDYMMAAEQGYEKAQANVAYLLDQEKSMLVLPSVSPFRKLKSALLHNSALALIYWTRSAKQINIDSLVKMGDYYLNGIGTDPDVDKAASCYTAASEFHQSAQALYNLGWMHENGVGLTQDFHLAKRFYDQALETNEEAYLPVTLSLFKLRLRSAWNTLTNGRINSIRDEPAPKKQWSAKEWISNFLQEDDYHYDDYDDDDILPLNDPMPGGDDDYYDDIDDGILESFIIIGLAAALLWLVYYRQQRQLAHRRQEEAARAQQTGQRQEPARLEQQPDPGLFPPPGDPAFPQWVAGGIGH